MTAKQRIRALLALSWLLLFGLAARLYALQVVRHEELARLADKRRRRVDWLEPRRGRILDREGRVLAVDRPATDVVVELLELDPTLEIVPWLASATRYPTPENPKDLSPVQAWIAARVREAREKVRQGAKAALVAHAPDVTAKKKIEKLAAHRIPGLVLAPDPRGGWSVLAPAALLGARDRALEELARAIGGDAASLRDLADAREETVREIEERADRVRAWSEPLVVEQDVDFDTIARVEEASVTVPGIGVRRRYARSYPRGPLAAHFLGYLTPLTEEELAVERRAGRLVDETSDAAGLLLGDVRELPQGSRLREQPRGRTGLEARLDADLAGLPGARVVEHDVSDRSRAVLLDLPPRDGEDVTTTIDAEIQEAAEKALDEALAKWGEPGAGGAAVLLSLETGDVLALASAPRFDPNTYRRDFEALNADPAKPFLHRAAAPVPPGSTFKVCSTFAFFGPGGLSLDTELPCNGALFPGKKGFHCAENHGGRVGLELALADSCNVFFFRAADEQGPDPLGTWANRLGFGQAVSSWFPLGCGHFPDRPWKLRRFDAAEHARDARALDLSRLIASAALDAPVIAPEHVLALDTARARVLRADALCRERKKELGYSAGELRNAAIGQGEVRATPVQVARLAALVASGGRPPRPRLLATDEVARDEIALDPEVLAVVQRGLEGCCKTGTASKKEIGLRPLDVAGKTGTAERGQGKAYYGWFMGYYPASHPEIAFACLVDTTRAYGGDACGPIARKLVEAYARSKDEEPKRRY